MKARIEEEIKPIVKQLFDYQIPFARVEKAGITTTGAECDNELKSVLNEYKPYRIENNLWKSYGQLYKYGVKNDKLYRKMNEGKWEEIL